MSRDQGELYEQQSAGRFADVLRGGAPEPDSPETRRREFVNVLRVSGEMRDAIFPVLFEMVRTAAEGRCMVCGWPLAKSREQGCVQGDCSFRPQYGDERYSDWRQRTEILLFAHYSG